MSGRWAILHQYRRLLHAAKEYPSTRRLSIIQEIRSAYREDAHKTGQAAKECIAQADVAEDQLNRYPKESRGSSDLEYNQN